MVNLIIKKAKIIDKNSKWNGKSVDLIIKNGVIVDIGKNLKSNYKEIDISGIHVSNGWYDIGADFCDPGTEYKEDVYSGLEAAVSGGYTRVCVSSDTNPPISDKSSVSYLLNKSKGHLCDLSVMGSLSKDTLGKELAEIYDMKQSGAVLFGDGDKHVQNGGLMSKALQYTKSFGAVLVSQPMDTSIAGAGQIREGIQSVTMGMKGIPAIAETIALHRDISLLEYSGGRLHIGDVSTKEGVDIIRKAKKNKLQISAGVDILRLVKTDRALEGYDVNYKVYPPLGSSADRKALVKAVNDGTIDVIISRHKPQDEEEKKVAFDHASYGVISLESLFGLYGKYLSKEIELSRFVECISHGAYELTGESIEGIEVGQKANVTCFLPEKEWIYDNAKRKSKSSNSPFIGEVLRGKVLGVINNNKTSLKS